jgi:hypothetical protein
MLIGIDVQDLVAWLVVTRFAMGLVLRFWAGIGGANRVVVGVWSLLVHFFQMSMLIRKRARAIPIMAAGDVRCERPMCISWLDLVELFEEFAGVKLAIVLHPQTLDGSVNAFNVGCTEKFCQLSGPVHGFLLNLHCLGFVRRDHVIHGPYVATGFDCDGVSRFDLVSLDCVLHLTDLVGVDHSNRVEGPGVLREFKIFL